MPAGFAGLEQQLLIWMLAMIRPGAAFLAAPIFGAPQVPVQVRLVLALAIGVPAAAVSGMALPANGIVSFDGLMLVLPEVIAGLALGFAVQIGFSAAMLGGEAISNTMGLGFAAMANPLGGPASPAIGQLLSMMGLFLFLGFGGHLTLIGIIVDSSVIIVENIYRHVTEHGADRSRPLIDRISEASHEIERPLFFSTAILICAFIPLFSMSGPAGALFGPMANTYAFSILGALMVAHEQRDDSIVRVTAEDLDTHENGDVYLAEGEYVLIPTEPLYLDSIVRHANGTVVLTLKRRQS